jgi:hypothetical protein
MTRPTKLVVDCSTGESVEVALTDLEIEQREADAAAYLEQKAADDKAATDKEAARQAVYKKLGLTADEVAAILA